MVISSLRSHTHTHEDLLLAASKLKLMKSLSRIWLCCGHKQRGDDDEEEERWSSQLPYDIMQLILQRLPLSDYLRCREVCLSWRAVIDPHPHQLPWLLLHSEHIFFVKDGCFVIDQRKISTHKSNTSVIRRECVGSIKGWLIMVTLETGRYDTLSCYFFLNPISGARVELPSSKIIWSQKIVASSVPTRRQNCYVAMLDLWERHLSFCRPIDKSWTLIKGENALEFFDMEIIDGKLYAATRHALEIMVFDIQLHAKEDLPRYTTQRLVVHHPNVGPRDDCVYYRTWYLVKDPESKELFLVFRKLGDRGFQVWKLEHCGITGTTRWVEIVDLGNRIMFLSELNNKIISFASDTTLLETNCIYFAFNVGASFRVEFGVFSLTKQSVKPLTFPNYCSGQTLNRTLWFTPNPPKKISGFKSLLLKLSRL